MTAYCGIFAAAVAQEIMRKDGKFSTNNVHISHMTEMENFLCTFGRLITIIKGDYLLYFILTTRLILADIVDVRLASHK